MEEEFLLVDPTTGQPLPVAEKSLQLDAKNSTSDKGPILALEVKQEQLEVVGPVCSTLQEMAETIRQGRTVADEAARAVGARAVALATSPLASIPTPVPQPRYLKHLPAAQLRLAGWMASKAGVEGTLLPPLLNAPCPATEAVQAILTHVRPALASSEDEGQLTRDLARILAAGTGSQRQRQTMANSQSLAAVVMGAVERTHGTAITPHRRSRRLQVT